MVRMINECPICHGSLTVKSLFCSGCNIRIEGDFELPRILSLSREQMEFVETFLRCRGNIREVERELGISYPTVRARLDEVVERLGYQTEQLEEIDVGDVLISLEKGQVSVEDALRELQGEQAPRAD